MRKIRVSCRHFQKFEIIKAQRCHLRLPHHRLSLLRMVASAQLAMFLTLTGLKTKRARSGGRLDKQHCIERYSKKIYDSQPGESVHYNIPSDQIQEKNFIYIDIPGKVLLH